MLAIPVGPDGIKFDGDLSNGTIVNQRTSVQVRDCLTGYAPPLRDLYA